MRSTRGEGGRARRAPRPGVLAPALLLLTLGTAPRAQEPPGAPGGRPRVGLVLSGGGARGAAHVGVLQLLEELHVPVDLVVGTSMGAVLGGLYAAGESPEEMQRVLREADWSRLFTDETPRDELWFRRRQDDRIFQVDLELGLSRSGLVLPPGLLLGQNVQAFLEQRLLPVAGTDDFDHLRLPFRCVATDLGDGSPVALSRGSLVRAIRASMSLPGVFTPVEIDGRLLIDGGAVDNVPIDVARALGAEVVIVVDISTPLGDLERLASPLGVSSRFVRILMSKNRARSMAELRPEDIALTPDLGAMTVMDFAEVDRAIAIGRAAADALRSRLEPLRVPDEAWQDFLARQRRPPEGPLVVRRLVIERRTGLSEAVLRRFVALREGSPLDERVLRETRERLAGLGIFEDVQIDVVRVPGTAEADVTVRPIEKAWGPQYLRFGLGISSDLSGGGEFDFGVQHTWTPLNPLGGEWRNEVQIGTRTRLLTEFYQPLDPGLRWFLAPSVEFAQDDLPLRLNGDKIAELSVHALLIGLGFGRNLGSFGEIRATYGWLTGDARPEIALPGVLPSSIHVDTGRLTTELSIDTLDSPSFPERGVVADLQWRLGDSATVDGERESVLRSAVGVPLRAGALTVLASLEGGITAEGEAPLGTQFELGGFRRLSGLAPGELAGNHYALAVLEPYYRLSERSTLLGVARYLGGSLEYGGPWQVLDDFAWDDLRLGGSLYLGLETFLGPAYLGVGLTEGGERSVYVFLGPVL